MKVTKTFTSGKMDQDVDRRFLPEGQYLECTNGRIVGNDTDDFGVLSKFKGMTALTGPTLPSDFVIIGLETYENKLYYIATNLQDGTTPSNGDGTYIVEYNKDNDTFRHIIRDIQSASHELLFSLDRDTPIVSIIIFEGLLIFLDRNNNQPYKINIELAAAQDALNQFYYLDSNDVLLIKEPPFREPSVTYATSSDVGVNTLQDINLQFAYQYEYEDGEVSAISMLSEVDYDIEEGEINDGRTVVMMSHLNNDIVINAADDRDIVLDHNTFNRSGTSDDINDVSVADDSRQTVVYCARNIAVHTRIDHAAPVTQVFVNPQGEDSYFHSAEVSIDGRVALFGRKTTGENYVIYKYDVSGTTTDERFEEVLNVDRDIGDDPIGKKVCMSRYGRNCFMSAAWEIYKSENFGNAGTWNLSIDVTTLPGIASSTIITSMCCSANGDIIYAFAYNRARVDSYLFRSEDGGDNWEVLQEFDDFADDGSISCSADGRIVAIAFDQTSLRSACVMVSRNSGISFANEYQGSSTALIKSVSVSTSGKYIYAGLSSNNPNTTSSLLRSTDFGNTFVEEVTVFTISEPTAVACVRNEVELKGLNNIDNEFNSVTIGVNTGNKHITRLRILAKDTATGRFFIVKIIDKVREDLADNIPISFDFVNEGGYALLPSRDVNKLYDNVPLKARALTVSQNSLIYGGYTDGYSIERGGNTIEANFTATLRPGVALSTTSTNKSLKTGITQTYGIVYYDDFNRSSDVMEAQGDDGVVNIPTAASAPTTPIYRTRITISHLAPDWATKFKIVRRDPNLNYEIINGFDSAVAVIDEIYLEITSFTEVPISSGDRLQLFSEINQTTSTSSFIVSTDVIDVEIMRVVDNTTGNDNSIPMGRFAVINNITVDGYSLGDVQNETESYTTNLFYIIKPILNENELLFEEIPGLYTIDSNGFHAGNTQTQTASVPGIVDLTDDFDVVWGLSPTREMYKLDNVRSITNLGRVNAVSENFRQVDRIAGLIASEQFVEDTNFNGLASVNLSLIPFKDLDKRDREIEFLSSEDTNVEVYQKDKISRILYRKNVLTTATGAQAVTQTEDIWGEQVRLISEYGMTHFESYASWGRTRFFVDADRGVILQKDGDTITPISYNGLSDRIHSTLTLFRNIPIRGYYEPEFGNYGVDINTGFHLLFSTRNNSWTTFVTFFPDKIVNDGLNVYSFKDRVLYLHDDTEVYNDFYGESDINETAIEFYVNNAPHIVKTFNAIYIDGDRPNRVELFTGRGRSDLTGQQRAEILNNFFENKENLQFSEIPMNNQIESNPYLIGTIESINGTTITLDEVYSDRIQVGDELFDTAGNDLFATVSSISGSTIVSSSGITLAVGAVLVGNKISGIEGEQIKGTVLDCTIRYTGTDEIELGTVTFEFDESKQ